MQNLIWVKGTDITIGLTNAEASKEAVIIDRSERPTVHTVLTANL